MARLLVLSALSVLLPCFAAAPASAADDTPAPADHWPAAETSPAFVWADALASNAVKVPGRSRPRNCQMVSLAGRVRPGRHGQMNIVDGAYFADFASGRRVRSQIAESGRFALEITFHPRRVDGELPTGWIMALDAEDKPAAFALVQRGEQIVLRLGAGEDPPAEVRVAEVAGDDAHHLVVNVTTERIVAYLNGERAVQVDAPAFEPGAWQASSLVFGADWHVEHRWAGLLERAAIYPLVLTTETVQQHSRHVRQALAARPEPGPIVVRATLRNVSQPPDASAYPRALVLCHYTVDEVVDGELDADELLVYHWGILGGEKQPILERTMGKSYRLKVEPYDRFADVLDEEQRAEGAFVFGPPSFYDVTVDDREPPTSGE